MGLHEYDSILSVVRTIPVPRRRTRSADTSTSPRVIWHCLKEPSAYAEAVERLEESNKRHFARCLRHLEENWRRERNTYEAFHETIASLRGGDLTSSESSIPINAKGQRRQSISPFGRDSKSIQKFGIHHWFNLLSTLHTSICCDWFGYEGVGIQRWSVTGNEVMLSWQRVWNQFDIIMPEKTRDSMREEDSRLSSTLHSISKPPDPSFMLPLGLDVVEDFETYLAIPQEPSFTIVRETVQQASIRTPIPQDKLDHRDSVSESTMPFFDESMDFEEESGTAKESDEEDYSSSDMDMSNYSSSDFDTDISVNEDGEFIVKTAEEGRQTEAPPKDSDTESSAEKQESLLEHRHLKSPISSLEPQSRPVPARRTRRLVLKRDDNEKGALDEEGVSQCLQKDLSVCGLAPFTKILRKKFYSVVEREHPLATAILSREVIKHVPQIYSSECDSPDISMVDGVDESIVEATMEGVLKGCPVMLKTLLRKNTTVLPTYREILPLVKDVNMRSDQPAKKSLDNASTQQFIFDCREKGRPKNSSCYFLETALPVASIVPEDLATLAVIEGKNGIENTKVEPAALLQHLQDITPDLCPYQSSLNNISASELAEHQNPYFRQAILHTSSIKSTVLTNHRHDIMKPPRILHTKTSNNTDIAVPCVLLLPPKRFHASMLSQLEELMDRNNLPFINIMVQIWNSVRPTDAWVMEKDRRILDFALSKLILDLILFRHASGHCIRYKVLSVIASAKQNPSLRSLLINSAMHPGNWLDQILRSGLSVYSSCRFETAICLLSLVTDEDLMSRIGMEGFRPLVIDIFTSLFRMADMFEDTSPVFFVVLTYLVCYNEQKSLLETMIKCGSMARSEFLVSRWPYLVAFAYTYWSRRRLLSFTTRESVMLSALDEAWRNPISRRAAREALKAIKDFVDVVSPITTQWPVKQKRTPMVHSK